MRAAYPIWFGNPVACPGLRVSAVSVHRETTSQNLAKGLLPIGAIQEVTHLGTCRYGYLSSRFYSGASL